MIYTYMVVHSHLQVIFISTPFWRNQRMSSLIIWKVMKGHWHVQDYNVPCLYEFSYLEGECWHPPPCQSSPLWWQVYYAFCFCNIFSMFDNTHTRHFSTIPNFNTSVYDHVHLCELGTFILSSSKIVELPIATTFSNV